MTPRVASVSLSAGHSFSKGLLPRITLLAGLGVLGDAHCGALVKHRSRVAVDPTQANLRQVHLLQTELFAELQDQGFDVANGDLGENIATAGIDLLALPTGTLLHVGAQACVRITGLRNPCGQIENHRAGLLQAVLGRSPEGKPIRKTGVMAVVLTGGDVTIGDAIRVHMPPLPHVPLDRV